MTSSALRFDKLPLSPDLLANLAELGFHEMTPVQARSLPSLLAGRDVIAQAQTGSGKTVAFGLALLQTLDARSLATQALVLCPTRELADQVARELRRLARTLGNIKILTLCGGSPLGPQLNSLEFGAQVIVGTPGRVLKHLRQDTLSLKGLRTLVLDEADRMLDMGFHDSMVAITDFAPARRQTLLFSATWADEVRVLSGRFQHEPVEVTVPDTPSAGQIRQVFHAIEGKQRVASAALLLRHHRPASAVLFCNTRQRCDEVASFLREQGFSVAALHGDLEQRDRDLVIIRFANQSCPILVATDVAARGLDIPDLALVVNVEIAFEPETHVHRIGRTGRAGRDGLAVTLCSDKELHRVEAIEALQQQPASWEDLPPAGLVTRPPAPRRVTLNINGGRKDKLRPGDILGALTGDGGVPGDQVGKIVILELQSYVAVDREVAPAVLRRLAESGIKGRRFKARQLA